MGTLRSQKERIQQHTHRPATEGNCLEKTPLRKETAEGVAQVQYNICILNCYHSYCLLILPDPANYLRPPNMKEHSSWCSFVSEYEENLRDEQQGKV